MVDYPTNVSDSYIICMCRQSAIENAHNLQHQKCIAMSSCTYIRKTNSIVDLVKY